MKESPAVTEAKKEILVDAFTSLLMSVLGDQENLGLQIHIEHQPENTKAQLRVKIETTNDNAVGLLYGPNKSFMSMMLTFLRLQQFLPHNRDIVILIQSPSTMTMESCCRIFGRESFYPSPSDFWSSNQISPPHIKQGVRREAIVDRRPLQDTVKLFK
jgi:hypothetical protein